MALTRRDLLLRYKHSIMGFGWAVFMPVANMLIFTMVFTRVARLDTGVPYAIFAFVGLLPWNLFASSLRFATVSMTNNVELVTKVYFPREVLPFSAVLTALVDFLVGATVLIPLMIYFRIELQWTVLLIPVIVLVQLIFTAALALLTSMGNVFYRDVKHIFEVVLLLWMFATSVVYPVERIGGTLGRLLQLNPMTPIIDAYRAVILRGEPPRAGPFLVATVISIAALVAAWLIFHRAEGRFAEEI
jgi:ABC-type polysaccharide/polyol phosphate export permease